MDKDFMSYGGVKNSNHSIDDSEISLHIYAPLQWINEAAIY